LEQKGKVLTFKEELRDKGALYWEYDGADEFERVVRGHLTQVIRQWEPESKASSDSESGGLIMQEAGDNAIQIGQAWDVHIKK
jgi:hypothetical protein